MPAVKRATSPTKRSPKNSIPKKRPGVDFTVYGTTWCEHSKSAYKMLEQLKKNGKTTRAVYCDKVRCPAGITAYPTWRAGRGKLEEGTPDSVHALLKGKGA